MTSRDSSTRRGSGAADPLVPRVPDQRSVRPDQPVQSIDDFVAFLLKVEAVCGRDDRIRRPTTGSHFLL